MSFYTDNPGSVYGIWILIAEIGICGVLPAIILITDAGRKNQPTLWLAVFLAAVGVCLNRWVMVLQVLAIPVLTFESWATYFPSWQEIATTILPVAYGVILISLSYRYLPIFPQEPELNPIDTPVSNLQESRPEEPAAKPEAELKPAEA
jgi:molybdopterin-containing oxidoreductase family membrane subunit